MRHSTNSSHIKSTILTPTSKVVVNALYPSAIGVDVHHSLLVCAWQYIDFEERGIKTVTAEFGTGYDEIAAFGQWCLACSPDVIIMESTGDFWRSPYEQLEAVGFGPDRLAIVNARDIKAVAGRKTDKQDAARLAEYARLGKFNKSFIPTRGFREQREVARSYRKAKNEYSRALNRYQKALNATGCRASNVFSDVRGVAARKILGALVDGKEGDDLLGVIVANCTRLKAGSKEIYNALRFNISETIKSLLQTERFYLDILDKRCRDLFAQLKEIQAPYEEIIQRLMTIPGIREISARLILAETSDDLSSFPDAEHLASWAGLCPGNNMSAGKGHASRCPKGNKYLRITLVECAQAVGLKKNGALYKRFLAFQSTKGRLRAVMATAHKLLRIIFALIRKGGAYTEIDTQILRKVRAEKLQKALSEGLRSSIIVQGVTLRDQDTGEVLGCVKSPLRRACVN